MSEHSYLIVVSVTAQADTEPEAFAAARAFADKIQTSGATTSNSVVWVRQADVSEDEVDPDEDLDVLPNCDTCGAPGATYVDLWNKSACAKHAERHPVYGTPTLA